MWRGELVVLMLLALTAFVATAATPIDPELRNALELAFEQDDGFEDRFTAEVWLLDMSTRLDRLANGTERLSGRLRDHQERIDILRGTHREATRAGLDPNLVLAVIEVESTFDRYAISRSGAQGLMQIMPFWLRELGLDDANLMDIDINLRMGCTILRHYLDREKGNVARALARYNGSLGEPDYPRKVLRAQRQHWYTF
ncbi:MAG: transglycosylase SLT domain-containing protein [Chromatiales bacterium]|nr:transglycosylase SLT domain-containing protein [Gammaproteobacteria bacterium]MCP5351979.1 transglycosylase SLT domain-containing protein [Chromatiales bacterium]